LGDVSTWVAPGCERCAHTGYAGRVGLFELVVVDEELATRIASGQSSVAIRSWLRTERGHRGLVDAAKDCIAEGVTSPAEVLRVMPIRALASMLGT